MFVKTKILIINDTKDVGYSYTPFFSNIGKCSNNITRFELDPKSFNLIVFTGGSDVFPEYYNDLSPKGVCAYNKTRDKLEAKIFRVANANRIPMFGICRGLQFINVMAGGRLIHDLIGHGCPNHTVSTSDDMTFTVNSYHHQACIPPTNAELLSWSEKKLSHRYIGTNDELFDYKGPEVEALYFEEPKAAGVQWHPEALERKEQASSWAYHLARDLLNCKKSNFEKLYKIKRLKVSYAT